MKSILSIDYDFFQVVSAEIIKEHYPDGVDLPTEISNVVWAGKYAWEDKYLLSVEPNWEQIELLQKILLEQDKSIPVMIAQSHIHAYEFVTENVPLDEKLLLVNVDMHHDYKNDNPALDCGNWISHLEEQYDKFKWAWIANRAGLDVYGFDNDEKTNNALPNSLTKIEGKKFDGVFLCRSDNWSPPHLDVGFEEITNTILQHFDSVKAEKDILKPRTGIQEKAKALRRQYK